MSYKEELAKLVETWTENNIDIRDNWNDWEKFLSKQGYIRTYQEVYNMDLNYLINEKDYDYWDEEDQKWNVESLIENDEDIVEMSNGCFFVHNQEYIDEYDIEKFYKKLEERKRNTEAYLVLNNSKNAFKRMNSLIRLLKNDFGKEKIFFASSMDKVRKENAKCLIDVLKIRSIYFSDYGWFRAIIFDNTNTTEEDNKYIKILQHIGFADFCYDAQTILESDFVILTECESIQDVVCFTYDNIEDFGNYIKDVLSIIEKECNDVDDIDFTAKINKRINHIIDNYWQNTFEFDYAEFEKNQ